MLMNEKNTNTPEGSDDMIERYALGMLSPAEAEAFEEEIVAGRVDPLELEERLQTMTALCEELASAMPTPRRAVKDAIMASILPVKQSPKSSTGEQTFILANEGEWQEMAPGISMKMLSHDSETGRTMVLVRLAPGAAYPPHRHMGLEECLVVEGDLHVDGTILHAGDFTASYSDKVHMDTHSEEGCLLLIASPLNDHFLEEGGGEF